MKQKTSFGVHTSDRNVFIINLPEPIEHSGRLY